MKMFLFTALTLSLLAPAVVFAECAELTSRLGAESRLACPRQDPDSLTQTGVSEPGGSQVPDSVSDVNHTSISDSCLDGGVDETICNEVADITFTPNEPDQTAAQRAATRIAAFMP